MGGMCEYYGTMTQIFKPNTKRRKGRTNFRWADKIQMHLKDLDIKIDDGQVANEIYMSKIRWVIRKMAYHPKTNDFENHLESGVELTV